MDVPISLAILLSTTMSLYQTIQGSDQVYFDASVTLLFFLLIGRYLDQRVRIRARGAAENLLGLKAQWAHVIASDGSIERLPSRLVEPGMRIAVAAGERFPADGVIVQGATAIDESLITGETTPRNLAANDAVYAGSVNLGGPVEMEARAAEADTLLAQIARLMATAEQARGRYVRLADRAARFYAPAVHTLAAAAFIGWMIAGAGWEASLTVAIAVLIITCPCALALAVPAVQVAASARLFDRGILLKAADGLERLAETDVAVFDKTGTLTAGIPSLANGNAIDRRRAQRGRGARGSEPPSLCPGRGASGKGAVWRRAISERRRGGSGLRPSPRNSNGRGAPRFGLMVRHRRDAGGIGFALVRAARNGAGRVSLRG